MASFWRGYYFKTKEEADSVKNDICTNGDLKKSVALPRIYQQHNLSVDEVVKRVKSMEKPVRYVSKLVRTKDGGFHEEYEEGTKFGVYVTTDINYAKFFAIREHTQYKYLLQAEIDESKLNIDGRDFLYTVFSSFGIHNNNFSPETTKAIIGAYGEKGLEYFKKANEFADSQMVFKDCFTDYMLSDIDVIKSYINSTTQIRGRYNTKFLNSLIVIDGISPNEVVKYDDIDNFPAPNTEYDDIIDLQNFKNSYCLR